MEQELTESELGGTQCKSSQHERDRLKQSTVRFTKDVIETNLRLLNSVKEYEKLIVEGDYLKIDDRYFASIRRWFCSDDRESIVKFITEIIKGAKSYYFEMIEQIKQGGDVKENYIRLSTFTHLIEGSRDGLGNLILTYSNDKLMKAKIETIKRDVNYIVSQYINTGNNYY